eukprot:scaffold101707_cov33-Phaeocystis_antarctica.AAC.1
MARPPFTLLYAYASSSGQALRAAPPALRHDGPRLSPSPSSGLAVPSGPADVPWGLLEPHL